MDSYNAQTALLAATPPSSVGELVGQLGQVDDASWSVRFVVNYVARGGSAVEDTVSLVDYGLTRVKELAAGDEKDRLASALSKLEHRLSLLQLVLSTSDNNTISTSAFVTSPLSKTALSLASTDPAALAVLVEHAPEELWDARFKLLARVPEWADPTQLGDLWPGVEGDEEAPFNSWAEGSQFKRKKKRREPRNSEQVTAFYLDRASTLGSLGLVSPALTLIQLAASKGVQGLDALGEELSLLASLLSSTAGARGPTNLGEWKERQPEEVVQAYMGESTSASVAKDVRRLVLPYLFTLQSRLERQGGDSVDFVASQLRSYVLSLPLQQGGLDKFAALIEASSPALGAHQRLISSDEELAKIALAGCYASRLSSTSGQEEEDRKAIQRVVECLPVLPLSPEVGFSGRPTKRARTEELEGVVRTLFTSASTVGEVSPLALYDAVSTLSPSALSRALDALDSHLASLELFSRFGVPSFPQGLAWFLVSKRKKDEQKRVLVRLVRAAGNHEDELDDEGRSEEEWDDLGEALKALGGPGIDSESPEEEENDQEGVDKPFAALTQGEVIKIYFAGLLAAGMFQLAKRLLQSRGGSDSLGSSLTEAEKEQVVLDAAREFYDNAQEGNLHAGSMRLAHQCLNLVLLPTPAIRKELELIEATSKLCSYRIPTPPAGLQVTPLEIRLSKDRLSFVALLLEANERAYAHPSVILELVAKLGYGTQDREADARARALIVRAAMKAGDGDKAVEECEKLVEGAERLLKVSTASLAASGTGNAEQERKVGVVKEVAWRACADLSSAPTLSLELDKKMTLLGWALLLCPQDEMDGLLARWTALSNEKRGGVVASNTKQPQKVRDRKQPSFSLQSDGVQQHVPLQQHSQQQQHHPGSITGFGIRSALSSAARSLNSSSTSPGPQHASSFPNPTTGRPDPNDPANRIAGLFGEDDEAARAGSLSSRFTKRLDRGVGWLIGADVE